VGSKKGTDTMDLEMNLREVKDFRTDAWLILKCQVAEKSIFETVYPCALETVNTVHNNQYYRSYFNWGLWYSFDKEFKDWMIALTWFSNMAIVLVDSSATANSLWVVIFDLIDIHNWIQMFYKLGLKYGYTTEEIDVHDWTSKLAGHTL
jgi:hypothetical protein